MSEVIFYFISGIKYVLYLKPNQNIDFVFRRVKWEIILLLLTVHLGKYNKLQPGMNYNCAIVCTPVRES